MIRVATQIRIICFHSKYLIFASGNHLTISVPFGYIKVAYEKDAMIICRYLVYESSTSVARVATGFLFPRRLENLDENLQRTIIKITRKMM